MEGEQKGGGKIKGITRTGGSCLQAIGAEIDNVMTISVAGKTRNATSVGDSRARFDGES